MKKIEQWMLDYPPARIVSGLMKLTGKARFDPPVSLEDLKERYIEICSKDPTEYTFSVSVADSWKTWKELKDRSPELRKHVAEWAEEANLARQSRAWQLLSEQAKNNHAVAKWMAEHKWKGYVSKQVGTERPGRDRNRTGDEQAIDLPKELMEAIRERTK